MEMKLKTVKIFEIVLAGEMIEVITLSLMDICTIRIQLVIFQPDIAFILLPTCGAIHRDYIHNVYLDINVDCASVQAIDILQATVKSQPTVHIFSLLGKTYMQAGHYEKAVENFNEAIELQVRNSI